MDLIVDVPDEQNRLEILKSLPKKHPWEQRLALIKEQFPSIDRLKWETVFREDPEINGKILGDILKIEAATTGKPGKRPSLDPKEAAVRYKQLIGEDYSTLPFTETFNALCNGRSVRAVAAKTKLDRNQVHRLMNGADPTVHAMEAIAKGFKKDPGFFHEYRMLYTVAFLMRRMDGAPESTVGIYRRIK